MNQALDKLERMRILFYNAKLQCDIKLYLIKGATAAEVLAVNNDLFLRLAVESCWRVGIIDLAKIVVKSGSSDFCLYWFLNDLIREGEDNCSYEIKGAIIPRQIIEDEEFIKFIRGTKEALLEEPLITQCESIRILRNKFYAHLDENTFDQTFSPLPTHSFVKDLLDRFELLIRNLGVYLTGADCSLNAPEFYRANGAFKRMADYSKWVANPEIMDAIHRISFKENKS